MKAQSKPGSKGLPGTGGRAAKGPKSSSKQAQVWEKGGSAIPAPGAPVKKRGPRLVLDTLAGTRQTVGRILRGYFCDRYSEAKTRTAIYALRGIGMLLKSERDERLDELESRMSALEKKMGGHHEGEGCEP